MKERENGKAVTVMSTEDNKTRQRQCGQNWEKKPQTNTKKKTY